MKIVRLSKEFYELSAILSSIADFKKICTFDYSETDDYYIIQIKAQKNLDKIQKEFKNYVLSTQLGD